MSRLYAQRGLLVLLLVLRSHATGSTDDDLPQASTWITSPGGIRVLMHTDAWFNWTHTVLGNVGIEWKYWDKDRPITIMTVENNITRTFQTAGTRQQRIDYASFAGSAVMVIRDVTSFDSGTYWVELKSTELTNPNDFSNTATLDVISDTDINLVVNINGESYNVAVSKNGTYVKLSDELAYVPTQFNLGVDVTNSTPIPSFIRFVNRLNGDAFDDVMCKRSRVCGREVPYHEDQTQYEKLYINIFIDFDIQNLNTLEIESVIILHHRHQERWTHRPGEMIVLANTTAVFCWSYEIQEMMIKSVNWRPKTHPEFTNIMSVFENDTWILPTYKDRLTSTENPGSMTMTLSYVQAHDNGDYRLKLFQPNTRNSEHFDDAHLTVLSKTNISLVASLEGERYALNVAKNGTNITLPMSQVYVPSYYSITVDIAPSAPTAYIHAFTTENKFLNGSSPRMARSYHSGIHFKDVTLREVELVVSVRFDVQNLGVVYINRTIIFTTVDNPEIDIYMNNVTQNISRESGIEPETTFDDRILQYTFTSISCCTGLAGLMLLIHVYIKRCHGKWDSGKSSRRVECAYQQIDSSVKQSNDSAEYDEVNTCGDQSSDEHTMDQLKLTASTSEDRMKNSDNALASQEKESNGSRGIYVNHPVPGAMTLASSAMEKSDNASELQEGAEQ